MQNTRNQSETTIAGLFEDGRPSHDWKLVTAHDIRAHLSGYTYVSNASISRTLRELGFKYHKQVRVGDERERIWAPYELGHKEPKLLAVEREKQRKRAG